MAKHTPGPWETDKMEGDFFPRVILPPREDWCKSSITINEGRGDMEECQANARLIAAAPDLLEALRELAGCLNVLNPNRRLVKALREARASIAKAQGER